MIIFQEDFINVCYFHFETIFNSTDKVNDEHRFDLIVARNKKVCKFCKKNEMVKYHKKKKFLAQGAEDFILQPVVDVKKIKNEIKETGSILKNLRSAISDAMDTK